MDEPTTPPESPNPEEMTENLGSDDYPKTTKELLEKMRVEKKDNPL